MPNGHFVHVTLYPETRTGWAATHSLNVPLPVLFVFIRVVQVHHP
jgi:hypothetical protein